MGLDRRQWQNLYSHVGRLDIMAHYGDPLFPMQLRMFAKMVLGPGPGGFDGIGMRKLLVGLESEVLVNSTVDATPGNLHGVNSDEPRDGAATENPF